MLKKLFYIFAGLMVGIYFVGMVSAARTAVSSPGMQIPISGVCNTATTTLFNIPNPFAGYPVSTSTVIFFELYGTNGATTTDIVVGTSTPAGLPISNTFASGLKEKLLALTNVATSSQFFAIAGQTLYSQNIGTTTDVRGVSVNQAATITLGPNDSLYGYATSSFTGSGNGGIGALTIPTVSSCFYKGIIQD
jgi:hypothetical protein